MNHNIALSSSVADSLESILTPCPAVSKNLASSELFKRPAEMGLGGFPVVDEHDRMIGWLTAAQIVRTVQQESSAVAEVSAGDLADASVSALSVELPLDEIAQRVLQGRVAAPAGLICFCDAERRYLGVMPVVKLLKVLNSRRLIGTSPVTAETWIKTLFEREALFVVASIRVAVSELKTAQMAEDLTATLPLVEKTLRQSIDPSADFCEFLPDQLGFMVVFRSQDWFERCEAALHFFEPTRSDLLVAPKQGSWVSSDVELDTSLHRDVRLSVGAVMVEPGRFASHHEVMVAAERSVERAKLVSGNGINLDGARISESGDRRASVH